MKQNLPVWRSLMYVPVNVEKYVDKAHTRGADCIQLDLEDSVPASEKGAARRLVAAAARRVRRGGADVVVRINSPLRARRARPGSFDLTRRRRHRGDQGAERGRTSAGSTSSFRARKPSAACAVGHTRLIAMIETPGAFFQMPAIAQASPRLSAMNIGGEDFALETAWSRPRRRCSCRSSR